MARVGDVMGCRSIAGRLMFAALAAAAVSACAETPSSAEGLTWGADAHPGAAVMPRVTGEGAVSLNGLFEQLDAAAEAQRADCLTSTENGNANYARTVQAPFTGPRFLSITVTETYYCGGAHPGVDIRPMTFDRQTGGLPDWEALWPGGEITASMQGLGALPAVSRAPMLVDWFRNAVRADPALDAGWLAQCDAWYGEDPVDEPVLLWLDASTGGVGMDWAALPHAARACGSPRVMPVETAMLMGASDDLLTALREGQVDRAFWPDVAR